MFFRDCSRWPCLHELVLRPPFVSFAIGYSACLCFSCQRSVWQVEHLRGQWSSNLWQQQKHSWTSVWAHTRLCICLTGSLCKCTHTCTPFTSGHTPCLSRDCIISLNSILILPLPVVHTVQALSQQLLSFGLFHHWRRKHGRRVVLNGS